MGEKKVPVYIQKYICSYLLELTVDVFMDV